MGALVLNYICLKIFVDGLGFYPTPSKILAAFIVVAYSYLLQNKFSFKTV
jgi:putative flippase GtrA